MKTFFQFWMLVLIGALFSPLRAMAQDTKPSLELPDDLSFRKASIMSEGTRIAAEVFRPKAQGDAPLPTILMCHGWGGIAERLRPDAIRFAKSGFMVVTIDYRGWGNSDGRVVASKKPEQVDGKWVAEVSEIREVVDPIDQTTDIANALNWVAAEKDCDASRIGLWGTSFAGGHVVYVAARDPRVKVFVSQVGSMDGRWVLSPMWKDRTYQAGSERTHGERSYPKAGEKFLSMDGSPILEKFMGYAPIEDIDRCDRCAKLFIIAENEELYDNRDHAILAFERSKGVKKLISIPGIKHYGVYYEARDRVQQEALSWFEEKLRE